MLSTQEESGGIRDISQRHIRMSGVSFEVVDKYKDAVYRAALTVTGNFADAEDIMQEVFLQYFQAHPAFASPAHEKAWLLRCAINAGRNLRRSMWRHPRVDVDVTEIAAEPENPRGSEVLAAVLRLPERYRTVIYLHYYENYTPSEIARMTNSTEPAIYKQLSRARAKLRKKLGGDAV